MTRKRVKMEMPKTVRILSTDFELVHTDDDSIHGECELAFEGQVIRLHVDNNNDRQVSTFIHETIEAINLLMELGLEHNQITSLELGLFSLVKENPEVMEWLKHLSSCSHCVVSPCSSQDMTLMDLQ
jgi:hypothetical protein